MNVPTTNDEVIAEFRANRGVVAAPYPDPPPMILLHTTGRKSGRDHVTPMRAMVDGEVLYVFGSAHGSQRHPDWYLNLCQGPEVLVEIGAETVSMQATTLHGEQRDSIFARQVERFPHFARMQEELERTIPVIMLRRQDA
jgi:deazaflavin-dependent oxidoreductase (nitroreductase family)